MSTRSLTHDFLIDLPAHSPTRGAAHAVHVPHGRPSRSAVLWAAIRSAYRRHRSRVALTQLDAHLLKDIGVSFAEAENETNKPFWQA